jgi:hypothetical protein
MPKTRDKLTDYLAPDQLVRLNHIQKYVTDLWAHGTFLHPLFTLHGAQHSQQVELIIGHILAPEHRDHHRLEDMLTSEQLFYLLASAWLHDTGMIWPPTEKEKQAASQEGMPIADWIRKEHHKRSYGYVVSHARELRLEPDEANTIGVVCQAHTGKDLTSDHSLTTSFLNTRFLAAVLRIADELDISKERTPPQLLELRWNEMDSTSRWHWLKHWCVLRADHRHEELKDEKPAVLQLSYQLTIRLPNSRYEAPFWDRVMGPIQETVDDQGVDSILRQKHLAIGYRNFEYLVQFCNDTLPDGTELEKCLNDLLMPGISLLSHAVMRHLNTFRAKNPVVAAMLQRQCRRFANIASPLQDISVAIGSVLNQYLGDLAASDNLSTVEDLHERFKDIGRRMFKESQSQEDMLVTAEKEWGRLLELGRRLMIFVIGDENDRRAQLWHIFSQFGPESNELLEQVATQDPSASLRQLAVYFFWENRHARVLRGHTGSHQKQGCQGAG